MNFFPRNSGAFRRAVGCTLILAAWCFAPPAPQAARPAWKIDPARTRISFSIDAVGYPRTDGVFRQFSGRIDVDFDHPAQSRVSFDVQTQSVDVGSASFSDYVRSEVMLNAARFPDIAFASTAVEKIDENKVRVEGNLTMLGVTRPLSVDVEVLRRAGDGRRLGFLAHARIDRLAFGMNSGYPIISRNVELVVASEAVAG